MQFNPAKLIEARTRAGLSVPSLASKSAVAFDTVYRLESGKTRSPSVVTVQRLAKATGVDWSYFFDPALPPAESEAV